MKSNLFDPTALGKPNILLIFQSGIETGGPDPFALVNRACLRVLADVVETPDTRSTLLKEGRAMKLMYMSKMYTAEGTPIEEAAFWQYYVKQIDESRLNIEGRLIIRGRTRELLKRRLVAYIDVIELPGGRYQLKVVLIFRHPEIIHFFIDFVARDILESTRGRNYARRWRVRAAAKYLKPAIGTVSDGLSSVKQYGAGKKQRTAESQDDQAISVKMPTIPIRKPDLRRWKATWRNIKGMINAGELNSKILKWLETTHPDQACNRDTMRRIIEAGQAGRLDG